MPVALVILLALAAVTPIVNAQSGATTINAQPDNLNMSWWTTIPVTNNDNATNSMVSSITPNATQNQLYMEKLNHLRAMASLIAQTNKNKAKTNNIQPLSASSAMGLINTPFNYNSIAFNIADTVATSYYGGGDALKGTSDTLSNVENYWKNDGSLCYYTNMGQSNGDPQHNCNQLYFNDGNNNAVLVSASTIKSESPDTGLRWTDMFIDSCYSNNNPMYDAFCSHYPNWYIGTTTEVPATTTMHVTGQFWQNYPGDGNPQSALNSACSTYGESNTDYHLSYWGWW